MSNPTNRKQPWNQKQSSHCRLGISTPREAAGYTLLELLLSLALSVAVVSAIGLAIQLYLVSLTRQQTQIERKRIARSVIEMISNDLRAGLQYKAADYSGLENLVKTQLLSENSPEVEQAALSILNSISPGQAAGDTQGSGTTEQGSGTSQSLPASTAQGSGTTQQGSGTTQNLPTTNSQGSGTTTGGGPPSSDILQQVQTPTAEDLAEVPDLLDESLVSFRPAMIGNSSSLTIDISRLPRLDQYNPIIADQNSAMTTRSDVKALTYFVSDVAAETGNGVQFSQTVAPGGLYRRQLDRAVATLNGDTGLVSSPDEYSELVAGEIAEIQFRYFDGESWLNDWNSVDNGGFPVAIEVVVVMDPQRMTDGDQYVYGGFDAERMEFYRNVVQLPGAEVMEQDSSQ